MSIKTARSEIQRLINAFAIEADKFHDISFSIFRLRKGHSDIQKKFNTRNHAIMLWQYYGNLTASDSASPFVENLQESDLQWGMRGALFSIFAVIEGEKTPLFSRMAKRAGNIFSNKEILTIRKRLTDDFQITNTSITHLGKPIFITNDNPMALWLSYLLYHISMTNPGRENSHRIDPDPFTLSLIALERLMQDSALGKADRSSTSLEQIHFKVAVSFPGELRNFVSSVVDVLRPRFGTDTVFYDYDYQAQLARPNLDTLLQKIYRDNSDLVVVFLCAEYTEKQWCGLEWRAIRDIIKSKSDEKIMFIRFDNADIDGIFSIDGYIDGRTKNEQQVAQFILQRVDANI